jgi:Copper type II ascorbate-dependent monooxygenase, C-terminal domain
MRQFAALVPALLLAAGCSSNPGSEVVTDSGQVGYQITFGPIPVPAGKENTQCVVKRLGNANAMHIGEIHNSLGNSSHHMIVYRVDDTVEVPTPFDCQPFTDTLDPSKGSPLMITQKKDEILTLPEGVAYSLDANQMVRLEMHYINATTSDVTLMSSSTMIPIADSAFKYEADFLFIGDPDINLAPGAIKTLGPIFYALDPVYSDAQFFAITGHEHKLGTNVTVSTAMTADDPGTSVYNIPNWTWSEPATQFQTPPFMIPSGGGFKFTCEWNNTGTTTVKFGESANDEMCFFWAYYYPSHGARVCVHTDQYGGHDLCCPGSQYCALLP